MPKISTTRSTQLHRAQRSIICFAINKLTQPTLLPRSLFSPHHHLFSVANPFSSLRFFLREVRLRLSMASLRLPFLFSYLVSFRFLLLSTRLLLVLAHPSDLIWISYLIRFRRDPFVCLYWDLIGEWLHRLQIWVFGVVRFVDLVLDLISIYCHLWKRFVFFWARVC